jgi:hypothetical protein
LLFKFNLYRYTEVKGPVRMPTKKLKLTVRKSPCGRARVHVENRFIPTELESARSQAAAAAAEARRRRRRRRLRLCLEK